MMNEKLATENLIKHLEKQIADMDTDYVSLLRRKWRLEDEIRVQKEKIARLELVSSERREKYSFWKKLAILLAASWAVFLSFCGLDRK